jgi:hypothetical protein
VCLQPILQARQCVLVAQRDVRQQPAHACAQAGKTSACVDEVSSRTGDGRVTCACTLAQPPKQAAHTTRAASLAASTSCSRSRSNMRTTGTSAGSCPGCTWRRAACGSAV